MYKEFLSDEEIKYLIGLTKNGKGSHSAAGPQPILKRRSGAKDRAAAAERAESGHISVSFPQYDSYLYDIDGSLQHSPSGNSKVDESITFSDVIIGNIAHRVSAWSHIPFGNLESFSIDVLDSATTYESVYGSSDDEEVNDRLATVFIPLTQFDEETDLAERAEDYELEDHDNVIVFPRVKPTYRQRRVSRGTFSDSLRRSHSAAGADPDDLCGDAERRLTVNANKGDAVLVWTLGTGGGAEPLSEYAHCHRLDDADRKPGKPARRYVASISYYAADPRAKRERGKSVRRIYTSEPFKCVDNNDSCASWAKHGECTKNAMYMAGNCAASCKLCEDILVE